MVLQLSCTEGVKNTPIKCNFQVGTADYSKFTPSLLTNLTSKHKLWLLNQKLNPALDQLSASQGQVGYADFQGRQSQGHHAVQGCSDQPGNPSTAREKTDMFRSSLTSVLSCVYAVFIVTLGVVIYISDLVAGTEPLAETFSIYLVVVGLIYFVYLYADIRRYLNTVKVHDTNTSRNDDFSIGGDGEWSSLGSLGAHAPHQPHHYCFSKGRHSGSFYLKIGAAGFCLGHLTHSGLLLAYQIAFLQADPVSFYKCASAATLVLGLLYPTYSFCQLFFIFKYSNVIINHCQEVARFAMMHCIASSLCFWVCTILRETVDSLHHADPDSRAGDGSQPYALPLAYRIQEAELFTFLNSTSSSASGDPSPSCRGPTQLSEVFESFSPYLYPFTIEYSILVVGVLFMIWKNIGGCGAGAPTACRRPPPLSRGAGFVSNVVVYADCHSSNKGLFAGLIVLAGAFLSIILFFVAMTDRRYVDVGLLVNAATELSLLTLLTGAALLAYRQVARLDLNPRPVSQLDDLLLVACVPAFFLQAILGITPAVRTQRYTAIATILLQVIQVLIQTPFIVDGLRRCSNSRALRLEKPGRELVTFLVVCNVAMWITETFEIKSQSVGRDYRSQFYGRVLWTMLNHLTLPLTMFYRFHSSVCLVDIWKSAYERSH